MKRLLNFMMVVIAVMMLHSIVLNYLYPSKPPKPAAQNNKLNQDDPQENEPKDESAEPESEKAPSDSSTDQEQRPVVAQAKNVAASWHTLGSVDHTSGYRFLVTLTNRGAAVERVELSNKLYRDLEDRRGYLGHLQLVNSTKPAGVRIRVVGAGTPAALADLQPDDILVAIDGKNIATKEEYKSAMQRTKPEQTLKLTVSRNGKKLPVKNVKLIRRPLDVIRPEIENYEFQHIEAPEPLRSPPSFLMTLKQVGDEKIAAGESLKELAEDSLAAVHWEVVDQAGDSITFRRVVPEENLEITKTYSIKPVPQKEIDNPNFPGFGIDLKIKVAALTDTPQSVSYMLDGANGLPLEGWWYSSKISRNWSGVGIRDIYACWEGQEPELFGCAAIAEEEVDPRKKHSIMYAGVDAQYFASIVIPQKKNVKNVWFSETQLLHIGEKPDEDTPKQLTNVTCRLVSDTAKVTRNKPLEHSFTIFTGPKRPDLIAQYGQPADLASYNLSDLVYYGWFGPVAKGMAKILHFFYSIVRNYGIAIILLTVLVRGCMFPLSKKQSMNMIKMQELQPEMKKLQEKYKKDLEKRTKAQQELFRKHNYRPMGGCLLMFVQLPIFIGLYRSLMVDIELRQAPLFSNAIRWCSNLSAPDMLFNWSGFMPEFITRGVGFFGLGPYFNLFPLITVLLFVGQQKMFTPPPADEQQAMQQKMMKYMMLVIGLMFYKVASGLCLYFIASSLWGIAERKLLPKPSLAAKNDSAEKDKKEKPSTSPSSNGSTQSRSVKKRSKAKKKRR